jgi:nitroreductase
MMIKEIVQRRSVRNYKSDPVSESDIMEIIKAAQFAPSAKHLRPIEFIVIRDQEIKDKLFKIVDQQFIKEAPVVIVPVSDTKKSNYSLEDISIASGYMFLQAAAVGLGTVWKQVHEEEKDPIRSLLNIPPHYTFTNLIPIGYPKEKLPPHFDDEFEENKIHPDKF